MGLMSLGIGQDPASETDREDRAGNHSVCDLEVVFLCDLVVGAVDAPAEISGDKLALLAFKQREAVWLNSDGFLCLNFQSRIASISFSRAAWSP